MSDNILINVLCNHLFFLECAKHSVNQNNQINDYIYYAGIRVEKITNMHHITSLKYLNKMIKINKFTI